MAEKPPSEIAVSIVVAVAQNRVIGRNNQLPWRLPEDLKYFKRVTMGHPIIMGRKTYDSIGRPLPGRVNIVVTRQTNWQVSGVIVCNSLEQALTLGESEARNLGVDQCMVIGGENFYRQVLPVASRLYLTEVHADVEGDAWFPDFDRNRWQEKERVRHCADASNPFDYSFVFLERSKEVLD